MASNTGFRLPGEALMTCNTRAVAVCRSSASRVSLKRRVFSIAITAWSAKVRTSAISSSVYGSIFSRPKPIAPIGNPSRSSGTPSMVWTLPTRASSFTS